MCYGTPKRTKLDHSYTSVRRCCTSGTQTNISGPISPERPVIVEATCAPACNDSESDESDVELLESHTDNSSDYEPSSSTESESDIEEAEATEDDWYIVSYEQLALLMKFCGQCGAPVVEKKVTLIGNMLACTMWCHERHQLQWHSQRSINKMPVGNLLVSAAILLSGTTYSTVSKFASAMGLHLVSNSTFCKVQRTLLCPVIQEAWQAERTRQVTELKSLKKCVLGGDGRCDSPGHSATYGSYSLMHVDGDGTKGSGQIVLMELLQVSEIKNSNHMEPVGFTRCVTQVAEAGVNIPTIATDRHVMVGSVIKTEFPHIMHQYDVWHLSKSITKKLTAKVKTKRCQELLGWIQSVSNHIWWCASTCTGDEQLLREKWISVLQHIIIATLGVVARCTTNVNTRR